MRRQDKDPLASFLPSIFNWRPYWVPRLLDTEQFSPEFFSESDAIQLCKVYHADVKVSINQSIWNGYIEFELNASHLRTFQWLGNQLCWDDHNHDHDIMFIVFLIGLLIDTYFAASYE